MASVHALCTDTGLKQWQCILQTIHLSTLFLEVFALSAKCCVSRDMTKVQYSWQQSIFVSSMSLQTNGSSTVLGNAFNKKCYRIIVTIEKPSDNLHKAFPQLWNGDDASVGCVHKAKCILDNTSSHLPSSPLSRNKLKRFCHYIRL